MDESGLPMPQLVVGGYSVSGAAPQTITLPGDPSRVTVLVSINTSTLQASLTIQGAGGANLVMQIPQTGYLELVWSRHGPLVQLPMTATISSGSGTLSVGTVSQR